MPKEVSKKSPKKRNEKQAAPRRSNLVGTRWCGTVFCRAWEGTCPVLDKLRTFFQKEDIQCAAVAYETGVHGCHPHWQFYFETIKKTRMKQALTDLLGSDSGFHLELAKGTKIANLKYIWAVHKQHEIGWVHYSKNCEAPEDYRPYKTENLLWLHYNMKPWQKEILERVKRQPDYRDILWVYEPQGNSGKSYLTKYLHYFHGAIVTGGKSEDVKYAIARWQQITGHYPVIIILDLPRTIAVKNVKNIAYTLEQIKNAMFFTGKYQSGMVASCNPPHLIVFANIPPEVQQMSADRWIIKRIDPDTDQFVDETKNLIGK